MIFPNFKTENALYESGYDFVIGCDEVGVGPLAGPVVAAACVLDKNSIGKNRGKNKWYYRVRDSKTILEKEREKLLPEVLAHCIAFGIGEVLPAKIDEINIHNASLLAMKRAIESLVSKLQNLFSPANDISAAPVNKIFLLLDGKFIIKDLLF